VSAGGIRTQRSGTDTGRGTHTGIAVATQPPGVQLMMAPGVLPQCGGCDPSNLGASVWLDDVSITECDMV
jgi:hypothetical protein